MRSIDRHGNLRDAALMLLILLLGFIIPAIFGGL